MQRPQLLLAVGTVLLAPAVAFGLHPIATIAFAAVALAGASQLVRLHDAFGTARVGAVLALAGGVLDLSGWQHAFAPWLGLAGLALIVTGSCTGLRDLLSAGPRREAAGRISRAFSIVTVVVVLARVLDEAEAGPGWVPDTLTPLHIALVVVVLWFGAYAALAPAVAREPVR
jgi:hypothetical protein